MLFLNVVDPVNYHDFVLLFKYYRMDCMICHTFFFLFLYLHCRNYHCPEEHGKELYKK